MSRGVGERNPSIAKRLASAFSGEVCGKRFDGDSAVEACVASEEDLTHAAAAEFALDLIRTDSRGKHEGAVYGME
jgi:hypothetical protein